MKMRSVIHMISEYLRHASDRCLTDLDGMFHILSPSRRLPLCIWFVYDCVILCTNTFNIPSDHDSKILTLERMPERVATRYLNQARGAQVGRFQDILRYFVQVERWNASWSSCVCGHLLRTLTVEFPWISPLYPVSLSYSDHCSPLQNCQEAVILCNKSATTADQPWFQNIFLS